MKIRSAIIFHVFFVIGQVSGMHPSPVHAAEQVGILARVQGDVKVFTLPSKSLPSGLSRSHPGASSEGSLAYFEGEYFVVKEGKPGDHVEKGNIVRTTPGAKARIVFPNGDQLNVGPSSSYRVSWNEDSPRAQTEIDLKYGKLRGIIEKGGPRSRLQIKTKTAVMGVRGTDWFIAQTGSTDATEIAIIRGSAAVTPRATHAAQAKPFLVKPGFSVEVQSTATRGSQKEALVEVRKTTQEDLKGIQKTSSLPTPSGREIASAQLEELQKLEKKAQETVLKDIQNHDLTLFQSLQKSGIQSVDDLNLASVQKLMKTAPNAPANRKPSQSEMEDAAEGAYEKYYRPITD